MNENFLYNKVLKRILNSNSYLSFSVFVLILSLGKSLCNIELNKT